MSAEVLVERYTSAHGQEWDDLVRGSRNGVFLFERGYMDYHSHRFVDHSLLFRLDGVAVAALPATQHDAELRSHGGLTFGGLVTSPRTGAARVLEVMSALQEYLRTNAFTSLLYKAVPHMYHRAPAEDDLYALFRLGASLERRDVSSTIRLGARLPLTKGRRSALAVARREGVQVKRSDDFHSFMAMEEEHLQSRFGLSPVHTGAELQLLADRFPGNIALFVATASDELVAGAVVFESTRVAHTQYLASTARGRDTKALDLVMHHLIEEVYASKEWFDFGISTEDAGRHLNAGLIANKESYGARATVYDFYRLHS